MKHQTTLRHLSVLLVMSISSLLHGAAYEWSNFAGLPGGRGSVDGTGTAARFGSPQGIAVDSAGNTYVADAPNHVIRKISKTGVVTTLAGQMGVHGHVDGTGAAARFYEPSGLVLGSGGALYVTEEQNSVIRKVTLAGVVTTLAGKVGQLSFADGTGSAAMFYLPAGMVALPDGSLLVADTYNHAIRKVTMAGVVTTFAGQGGVSGTADGSLTDARFKRPEGIARAADGTLFITDAGNSTIRKITPAGVVSTIAGMAGTSGAVDGTGTAALFDFPTSILVRPNGVLWVADYYNAAIREVTQAGVVTTIMGALDEYSVLDGTGTAARFGGPYAMAVDGAGAILITDGGYAIRKTNPALQVTTLAGLGENPGSTDGTGTAARFKLPHGIAVNAAGEVIIADASNRKVRKATPAAAVSTVAGTGAFGSADGPAATATFGGVYDVVVDATGVTYVADGQNTIRKIDTNGEVSTLAGMAGSSGSTDGSGAAARFNNIQGIALGSDGTLYVADSWNHKIRKVTPMGEVTTFAGSGTNGHLDGAGTAARFAYPAGLALDAAGNVYVADTNNNVIRKITPAGEVTTLAGMNGLAGRGSADGTGSAARFWNPSGIAVDAYGNLIVCDTQNHTLRRITQAGVVTTIGGAAFQATAADGLGTAARFSSPMKLSIDSSGVIYVADRNNHRIVKGVPLPEIGVQEPAGVELVDGAALSDYGQVSLHQDSVKTFTLINHGGLPLTGLSLSITGTNAAEFIVENLAKSTINPAQSMTFTVTFTGNVSGIRTAALSISSNDADEPSFDINLKATAGDFPGVISSPVSQVTYEGDPVMFSASATHPTATVKYQWLKNGSKISGATSSTYPISSPTLKDGGTYAVDMITTGASVRRSATLVVVKSVTQTLITKAGTAVKLNAAVSGPATFTWTYNNQPYAGTTNPLSVFAQSFGWSGIYRCYASGPGGGPLLAAEIDLRVFDHPPTVVPNQGLPDGTVGWPYTHQILRTSSQHRYIPTSYSSTGLPPGVTLNTSSGLISGYPTKAGSYDVIVSAKNSLGGSSSTKETVIITKLADVLMGSFTGIVARHLTLNADLGGRVDLTVANTALISGSLIQGTVKYPFTGQLDVSTTPRRAIINITRPKLNPLTLTLLFDVATQTFAAGSKVASGLDEAAISGWRLKWQKVGTVATSTPKLYTFGLRTTMLNKGEPAGDGYGSFTLNADGKVTLAGKANDGVSYTCATFVGPNGQLILFSTLLTPAGSLHGILDIDADNDGAFLEETLEGSATLLRRSNAKSRVYPKGFGPTDLNAFGSKYTPPVAPALVLNMALGDKAGISFSDGGLLTASINPNVTSFDLLAGNKPLLPASLSPANPGSVKITKLDAKTGLFTGTFVLNDVEQRTGPAFAGKMLKRTATFSGILTRAPIVGDVGVGHFLLPEMPQDAAPPKPATTPTTTPIQSGSVLLYKVP